MLFFRDDRGHIKKPTATYWGARLLTTEGVQPGDQPHEIYPAVSDVLSGNHDQMITAYAVHRPDELWALLLINRDPSRAFQTSVIFRNTASGSVASFDGPLDLYQYSAQHYLLGGPPDNPYPITSEQPHHQVVQASSEPTRISLPPHSLTLIRGALSPTLESQNSK